MSMRYQSFVRKWSSRFLRYTGHKLPRAHTAVSWCDQLEKDTAHCNWVRLIVPQWQGGSFEQDQQVQPLIEWLEQTCMHPCFVKLRAKNTLHAGVQVWLSHQEDVAAFQICEPTQAVNIRYVPLPQAREDWLRNWTTTPGIHP
jgi:hypothetical protein